MLNSIILIGRLVADPESQYTSGGQALAKFRIAVDRPYKNQETGEKEADFINIVAWRKTAEFVTQYLGKGRLVAVQGRLQIRQWTDQSGERKYTTEVIADQVQGLDRPADNGASDPVNRGTQRPAPGGFNEFDDSDPFADE